MKEIYLDNSATTKCLDEVIEEMAKLYSRDYGNPSSMHMKGVVAENHLKDAKEIIAKNLMVNQKEIYFTSGGTESDNTALIGAAIANRRNGKHIITTKIEHPAILRTVEYLATQGFEISYLGVNEHGVISLEELRNTIREDTILVSIMHTNNEIGSVQPIAEAGALIKSIRSNILFHVDAVQGYGKFRILPKRMGIDMMSVSGHKIHGPKGVGILYIAEKTKIQPYILGGGQQSGMRSGTENVPGIVGMAIAIKTLYNHLQEDTERLYEIRDYFISRVLQIPDVKLNGPRGREGAPHIVSISVRGIRSEVLLHALEDRGIYVSAGSACASHKHSVSDTLSAIGLPKDLLESTLRFSFSVFTTKEELEETIKALQELIPVLRKYTRR